MGRLFSTLALVTGLALGATAATTVAAQAGGVAHHSGAASQHSGAAASHGSAAVASGAGAVVSVPLIAGGSVLAVTGAGLQSVGESAVHAGSEALRHRPLVVLPAPDGAPRLD